MTKAALNKLLVEERMKLRAKHKQSLFMKRTLSIYNGQKIRFVEWRAEEIKRRAAGKSKETYVLRNGLAYTLEEFRTCATWALGVGQCCYCHCKLTLSFLTPDHADAIAAGGAWTKENLNWCCKSCNWEKGRMSALEFRRLLAFAKKYLSLESAADLKRRLSIGGKWSPR